MHCDDCQNLLIDLAYGELDEARAADVRQHVEGCASCGADWSKLQRGRSAASMLPVAEAPVMSAALAQAITAAMGAQQSATEPSGPRASRTSLPDAKAQNTQSAQSTQSTQSETEAPAAAPEGAQVLPLRGGTRWLDRLAALAVRREVAMAAVFLLALGVGVTTLYNPSRNPAVTEDERPRDVIPAVEVNSDPAGERERAAHRRAAGESESLARARAVERTEPRAARPANAASAAVAASPQPAPSAASAPVDNSNNVESPAQQLAPRADDFMANQRAQQQQRPANNVMPGVAFSNAGTELAGVRQSPSSPAEVAARGALERGDTSSALSQFRAALASASDDVTRARLQREIASLEASQAAQAAQIAQNQQAAQAAGAEPGSVTATTQTSENSYRRPTPARAAQPTMRARPRRSNASSDNLQNFGY
jgi:hypothetical protein